MATGSLYHCYDEMAGVATVPVTEFQADFMLMSLLRLFERLLILLSR